MNLSLLVLIALGAALLAPFMAAHLLLLANPPVGSRLADWVGLTIGLELGTAFALTALACAVFGRYEWPGYYAGYAFAGVAPLLSYGIVRAHLRHLRGDAADCPRLGMACLTFALGLGLGLVPWVLGAPLPLRSGELAAEQSGAGNPLAYTAVMGPVAFALMAEAWIWRQRRAGGPQRLEAMTALALTCVVLGTALLLPRLPWLPRQVAARERQTLRAQAQLLDEPRRRALADVLAGQAPALGTKPCPLALPDDENLRRFAAPATSWATLAEAGAFWRSRRDVAPCLSGVAFDLNRNRLSRDLDGPRRRTVFAALDDKAWQGPWPERDAWVSPAEVRRRVRERSGIDGWQVDATLLIENQRTSFSVYGRTNLGEIEATVWLWSYVQQSFVCGGKGRVGYAAIDAEFHDAEASTVRDAVRMRALAMAAADLRAVAH